MSIRDRFTIIYTVIFLGAFALFTLVVYALPRYTLLNEIDATLQEEALLYQEAPVKRVTGFDTPFPLYALEDYYLPEAARIADGIRETYEF